MLLHFLSPPANPAEISLKGIGISNTTGLQMYFFNYTDSMVIL